jgi:hypothetical protein
MDDQVICLLITSQACNVIEMGYPGRVKFVLAGLDSVLTSGQWQDFELDVLGK